MSNPNPPTVLLVIDLQQCLVSPGPDEGGPHSTPSLTTNVSRILARWRALHYPLIHIHHRASDPRDPLHASHPASNAAHECAAPLPREATRHKKTSSAFVGSGADENEETLLQALEALDSPPAAAREKVKLVCIGMDGAQCVNSTTRSAADLGFDVTVVADACASFGMAGWKGAGGKEGWGPEETHDMAMAMLAGSGYARVVTTEELLRGLD